MQHKIIIILAVFLSFSLNVAAKDTINFAPLPLEKSESVLKHIKPMLDFLEEKTSKKIDIIYHASYDEILEGFQKGSVDIAFLGPLPFVSLLQSYSDVEPLVKFLNKNGESTYRCVLVARRDSGIFKIDMQIRTIALTQPLSTCGFLMTESLLNRDGYSLKRDFSYKYVGSHANVALDVILGNSQIGGIKSSISAKYEYLGLKEVASSKGIPGFVLVANKKTLTPQEMELFKKSLLALSPLHDPDDAALMKHWGEELKYGCVAASIDDYEPIAEAIKRIVVPNE